MTDVQKEKATEALNSFWVETFDLEGEPDYRNPKAVPFYYTETLDGKHDIQFYADFEKPSIYFEVSGERMAETEFENFEALCEHLNCMTEGGIVHDADEFCYDHGLCEYM